MLYDHALRPGSSYQFGFQIEPRLEATVAQRPLRIANSGCFEQRAPAGAVLQRYHRAWWRIGGAKPLQTFERRT
jgi:hypothetical protein